MQHHENTSSAYSQYYILGSMNCRSFVLHETSVSETTGHHTTPVNVQRSKKNQCFKICAVLQGVKNFFKGLTYSLDFLIITVYGSFASKYIQKTGKYIGFNIINSQRHTYTAVPLWGSCLYFWESPGQCPKKTSPQIEQPMHMPVQKILDRSSNVYAEILCNLRPP